MGVETSLNRTLSEHDVPVDRDVFMRELDFYEVSVGRQISSTRNLKLNSPRSADQSNPAKVSKEAKMYQ